MIAVRMDFGIRARGDAGYAARNRERVKNPSRAGFRAWQAHRTRTPPPLLLGPLALLSFWYPVPLD
jgi:hypothetical protein